MGAAVTTKPDPIYQAILNAVRPVMFAHGPTTVAKAARDAVVALATTDVGEHPDQPLDLARWKLELAWRTLRREAPHIKSRSLAGAILALVSQLRGQMDGFNAQGNELVRQDQEIAGLKLDVQQAEANYEIQRQRADKLQERVSHLERQQARYERPGFSVILDMIRRRQTAAKEQYDADTERKLEVLWQAFDCVLLPHPDKATPRIEFSWPPMVDGRWFGLPINGHRHAPVHPVEQEVKFTVGFPLKADTLDRGDQVTIRIRDGILTSHSVQYAGRSLFGTRTGPPA